MKLQTIAGNFITTDKGYTLSEFLSCGYILVAKMPLITTMTDFGNFEIVYEQKRFEGTSI